MLQVITLACKMIFSFLLLLISASAIFRLRSRCNYDIIVWWVKGGLIWMGISEKIPTLQKREFIMDNPIADYIYEITSKRIKDRIKSSGLRYQDIYSPDEKLISKIVNNKRGKNNPYLIPRKVLYNDADKCGLLYFESLKFKDEHEVLWGTDKDIKSYAPSIFPLLIDLIESDSEIVFDLETLLCDYVPYAIIRAYWDVFFCTDHTNPRFNFCEYEGKILNFPAFAYGISEDEIFGSYDCERANAVSFLYNRCGENYIKIFLEFTYEISSFTKLDKVIKNSLVINKFIPMLTSYMPDASSLGIRVKDMIFEDISYVAPLVYDREVDNVAFRKELIGASLYYATMLAEIQATHFPLKK